MTPRQIAGRLARGLGEFFLVVLARLFLWGAALWVAWLSLGSVLVLPAGVPHQADAVVVLGGGEIRYPHGRDLVLQGYAQKLMVSHPKARELADAHRYSERFELFTSNNSDSTWNEAQAIREWAQGEGVRRILVVTDPPHILRAYYVWSSVMRDTSIDFTMIMTEPPWWSAWRWWDNEQAALFAGIEVLKLGYYLVRYRFGFWLEDMGSE